MAKLLIVANFKSNKNLVEAKLWLDEFLKFKDILRNLEDKEVVICPSFPHLLSFSSALSDTNVKVGAQDVSPFDMGAYTGAVNAIQLKDFAEYVLIGHSERRSNFQESGQMLEEKVKRAIEVGLKPIFFAQDVNTPVPSGVKIGVYEPPNSISTVSKGVPDDPSTVLKAAGELRNKYMLEYVLYGGSVNSDNVSNFTSLDTVDGVIPGKASLDAQEFIKIIQNA